MSAAPARRLLVSRLGVVGVLVALLSALSGSAAVAAPESPSFGTAIDDLAAYQGQTQCDPTEKPGVVGFRALVRAAYSGVNTGGISRSCEVGGRSEHKEGRAWDWMLRADVATDRAKADDLLTWLLATDEHGNDHAMARRLGVMYVIWDRQWWSAWAADEGWQPYSGASPHTDHVHVSFSWDGALKRTSWWDDGEPSTGPSPTPSPTAPPQDPFGDLEEVTATTASGDEPAVRAVGWAIDPDAATFTRVRLDVDGAPAATVVADRERPDVAADNPPYSPNHGFDAVVPVTPGTREVCATAVDQGAGQDQALGCRTVIVPAPSSPTPAPTPAPPPEPPPVAEPTGPQPRTADDSCPSGTVPAAGFDDTVDSVHGPAVDCAVWWQVAKGTGERSFTPDGSLTRGQIASFLARTIAAAGVALPARPADAFDDDDGSVHELAVNQMAALGVVQGKAPRRYAADDVVTRAQVAAYLVRAHEYRTGVPLPAGDDSFTDDDGTVHEAAIGKAAEAGFTGGTSATTFSPDLPTTRGQVASFLTRVLDLLVETGWAELPAA